MWYFTWILGLGLALAFGIINALWLEASYAFGDLDEAQTRERFESRSDASRTSAVPFRPPFQKGRATPQVVERPGGDRNDPVDPQD